jgi:iron complex transport system substrate-binding protein
MELPEELQERIDIIQHKLKFVKQRPVVACVEGLDPFAIWPDDNGSIKIAGGETINTQASWSALQQQNPDIIILMLKEYSLEESTGNIEQVLQLPGFTDLKAIKNNRFYIADSKYISNKNIVDSVEILAEIINPKQFIFGYEGDGWIKFELS